MAKKSPLSAGTIGRYCRRGRWVRQTGDPFWLRRVRFYIAAYRNPLLAFLGIADRWDHWNVARQTDGNRRRRFLEEAERSTIPLLEMLGMGELKGELESWTLANGPRQRDYQRMQARLAQVDPLLQQAYEIIQRKLESTLSDFQIAQHPPTLPPTLDPAQPDIAYSLSVHLLVKDEATCYQTLRRLHEIWQSVDGTILDTLSNCHLNGHRSLRTTVLMLVGQNPLRVHFQICTPAMDEINRWGIMAILLRSRQSDHLPGAWWSRRHEGDAAIRAADLGTSANAFSVFSPQGELFAMTRDCTVVDYAYKVHSGLAYQCQQFFVNGIAVAPTTALRHLDLVELVRDPQATGPTHAWLEAAKTGRARNEIRRFLRRQGQGALHGQRVLEDRQKDLEKHYKFDIPKHHMESALKQSCRRLHLARNEDLFAEIAAGRLNPDRLLHPIFAEELARQIKTPPEVHLRYRQIKLAQCCRPCLGDEIVGCPRYRNGLLVSLTVHTQACKSLDGNSTPNTLEVSWLLRPPTRTIRRLDVTALDSDGLLGAALAVIYTHSPQALHKAEAEARHGQARMRFTIEADQETIDEITATLQALPNHRIEDVRQMHLLLSEWEELAIPLAAVHTNPYSRLPVSDRDMLFGRQRELSWLQDLLAGGCGLITLRGQKRIGKTSLLLHLRDYRLEPPHFFPLYIDFQDFGRPNGATTFYEIANAVYNGLQRAGWAVDIGAPAPDAFQQNAAHQLETYLRGVQINLGGRLVLLMDEFSTTFDHHHYGWLDGTFFLQWRSLVQRIHPIASIVAVIQQVSYDRLREAHTDNPAWQLLEIAESLTVRPLSAKETTDLVALPMRTYTTFTPAALHRISQLTGGSPFLTQAFCAMLNHVIARHQSAAVDLAEVESVIQHFMAPDENLFTHLLDLARGVGDAVVRALAHLSGPEGECVSADRLAAALTDLTVNQINHTLTALLNNDILQPCPSGQGVQFASLLFAHWLVANPIHSRPQEDH